MDPITGTIRTTPLTPRGAYGVGTSPADSAPAADRFMPSPTDDAASSLQQFRMSLLSNGAGGATTGGQSKSDRDADAALARQCGSGCGCAACSPVAGDDDPLKTLRDRDSEVRQHEAEHLRAAGEFAAGGPTFDTVTTRSGQTFVVGGKVHVDISEIPNDPKRTLDKMKRLRAAALAPLSPSDQDRRVAAQASSKEAAAQAKLAQTERGQA